MAWADEEPPTRQWWAEHYEWGARRAGGMPPEIAGAKFVALRHETDPHSGDQYVRVVLRLPASTAPARARELAHMVISVFAAEGYTLRRNGRVFEALPGEGDGELRGELGQPTFSEARVCSGRCMACIFASESRVGCCTQGSAFSLADIGAALLDGDEEFVAHVLALPGERDHTKWQPYLASGKCIFHSPDRGCTLKPSRMPLQCRTYLCMPERLLPPDVLSQYAGFVEALEEAETFVEEHMRLESGVDFGSPPGALKEAAAKAFAAWEAGR
jgi:hypothetical protein